MVQISESEYRELQAKVLSMLDTLDRTRGGILVLKDENQKLQEDNSHLNKLIRIQKNTIKELEENLKKKKLAGLISKKDKTSAKHTLNSLIDEIDRCIKLVNTMENQ